MMERPFSYKVIIVAEITVNPHAEFVYENPDQMARVIEAGVSCYLLELSGEGVVVIDDVLITPTG